MITKPWFEILGWEANEHRLTVRVSAQPLGPLHARFDREERLSKWNWRAWDCYAAGGWSDVDADGSAVLDILVNSHPRLSHVADLYGIKP